jgi:hypothetical protein
METPPTGGQGRQQTELAPLDRNHHWHCQSCRPDLACLAGVVKPNGERENEMDIVLELQYRYNWALQKHVYYYRTKRRRAVSVWIRGYKSREGTIALAGRNGHICGDIEVTDVSIP